MTQQELEVRLGRVEEALDKLLWHSFMEGHPAATFWKRSWQALVHGYGARRR